MYTRTRVIAATLVFACAFTAGIVGSAHDYVAQISGTTLGASLFTADAQPLAFGGYTTPSPSPSPSHTTSNPSNDGCGGCGGGTYGGSRTSSSPSPSPSTGGGGRPSENSGRNAGDSFGGGTNNSNAGTPTGGGGSHGSDPTNTSGGTRAGSYGGGSVNTNTNGAGDHGCGGGGCQSQAERQAQQTQEAAHYAETLRNAGSGDPTPGRTPQSISQRVSDTFSSLAGAMSNLMGGPSEPTIPTRGNVTGLDGDVPVYQGTGIDGSYFRDIPSTQPQAPGYSTGAPTDYTKAMNTAATTGTTPHYVTSAATEKALNELKHIDTEMMAQAAKFQQHFANKVSTADSIVAVNEIRKTVAGECAGGACSDKERVAIANAIMNRLDAAAANKPQLDIHDVLDAFDANMQRPSTLDNKVYAGADVGTPANAAGEVALNDALNGNLPSDMPDAVRNATHYYNPQQVTPAWSINNGLKTPYGPHTFMNDLKSGLTGDKVAAAREAVAAGQVKAEISYYKGVYNSASPQAAKVQSEITRSLTVAGRNINIVTQSDGLNTQGPSHVQTRSVTNVPGNKPAGSAPAAVSTQQTSLDDPKNSNVPAPADVKNFLVDRGMAPNAVVNGQFAYRLSRAIASAETVTGKKETNLINSSYRTPEEQAGLYATYIKQDYVFKGVTYHPNPANLGHLAGAPPGGIIMVGPHKGSIAPGSRHQFGAATDLNPGPIRDYIRANAGRFGLETLGKKPDGTLRDVPHIQLGSQTYADPSVGKNAEPLNANIGLTNTTHQPQSEVVKTPTTEPATNKPAAGGGLLSNILKNLPSPEDVKKSLTPSVATQKKLEFVSKLPTWMQNIVISIYTGKGGTAPSSNTESHSDGSAFFPEAQPATSTVNRRTVEKVDVRELPWWQQYQAKLDAIQQSKQQQSI